MRSGGDLLVASVHNTYSVDVDQTARDVGEQFGRIEPAEGFLRDQQRLPDHGRRVLHLLEPLGRGRPEQVGLDAATASVLFFVTGGVSFCSAVGSARGS